MSYILEALKKSDQTRKQGNIPDLQTIHVPVTVEVQQSRWPYIVIVVLLMGLVFLLGWMKPWQSASITEPVANSHKVSSENTESAVMIEQQAGAEVVPESKQLKVSTHKPDLIDRSVNYQPQVSMMQGEPGLQPVPHLQEMPESVKQAIPDMTFAGHVYSSNPAQRSVIINGSAMGEGDLLMNGLSIDQITDKGVIFDYQSQRFRIDILQDWSFD